MRLGDTTTWSRPLFRIHRVAGAYPAQWNQFRMFGPIEGCRWDPHPLPRADHPGYGLLYTATDPAAALAEAFGAHRLIRRSAQMALTGWEPTRPLRLLDLSSNWPIRHGAGRALSAGPRSTCRAWARGILEHVRGADTGTVAAGLDGLIADSTLTGAPSRVVALWEPAVSAFPAAPAMSMPLDAPALSGVIADASERTGYRVG
ncbi:MAG: RES domain-containing protein [Nocardioidaceae bacterium]